MIIVMTRKATWPGPCSLSREKIAPKRANADSCRWGEFYFLQYKAQICLHCMKKSWYTCGIDVSW